MRPVKVASASSLRSSSGSAGSVSMALAISNNVSRRLLLGATNKPSANAISAASTSSIRAAIRRALSIIVREVSTIGEPHRAIGMRSPTGRLQHGIAALEVDRLGRNAELIGDHLAEARLVPLPARLRP